MASGLMAAERNLLTGGWSKADVDGSLLTAREWVMCPAYADREGWRALAGTEYDKAIRRGEKWLGYEWKMTKATDYIEYERSGNRKIMEDPQKENNLAMSELLLAELAEGKGRFLDQIINYVWMECERTSWVLSAHLHRQTGGGDFPDYKQQIVDLGSGEIAGLLAWTYYLLHEEMDRVNPLIAERLKVALHERVTVPYMTRDKEWWLALDIPEGAIVNNWNPWCNFNVLQTILLVEDDAELMREATWRSMRSVDQFINYVKADGACEEGPSYWGHAAGKLYDYLDLLYRATSGTVDIFSNPQIQAMGEYVMRSYVGNGWVVNFADASAQYSDNLSTLMYRYAQSIGSDELRHFAAYMAGGRERIVTGGTDFWRTISGLSVQEAIRATTPALCSAKNTWYEETEFCYMRRGKWFLGSKGGHNNESHNHNDVGTCVLYYDGEPVLIDAGVGTYTKQTFSAERYSIWTMQSGYHNLPVINGVEQHQGAEYHSRDIRYVPRTYSISYDIAGAYPEEASVESWRRGYMLRDKGVDITDGGKLRSCHGATVLTYMVAVAPQMEAGRITLALRNGVRTICYDAKSLEARYEPIPLTDPRLSKVWGDTIYRIQLTAKRNQICPNYTIQVR